MLDMGLQNYVDWHVKPVMRIRDGYGYRVVLKYLDGTEKTQQRAGFHTKREANAARDKTIAELYSGSYVTYANVTVKEFLDYWLEEDIAKRVGSDSTLYNFRGIAKNHIIPMIGKKKMVEVTRGDVQKLYNAKAEYSVSVARVLKTVMNLSFQYAVTMKVITTNPAAGINLPKTVEKKKYHQRTINTQKTLTLEQIFLILEKSKDSPIHMQVLFNVLMGLRRSEIIGLKYEDIDYFNRTMTIQRQLGKPLGAKKEDYAAKTLTKQEIKVKTESSNRVVPIPDYVFEAILKEKEQYEKHKNRRKREFQDLGYICCSAYGRPRSKGYHVQHYKKLLRENNLPDIRWHDLRATFCTLLLKNNFNPKAVSKLMGHTKEIITLDVYGDNKGLAGEEFPELLEYMEEVLPEKQEEEDKAMGLADVVIDVLEYYGEAAENDKKERN